MSSQNLENQFKKIITQITTLHPQIKQLTDNIHDQQIVLHSLGCLMGAFIGDSLGSFCQFEGLQSKQKMQIAMKMPGGGPFNLLAGQLTDDSQMSIHMLQGLMKYEPTHSLNQQLSFLQYCIAQQYVKWLKSKPFDIGNTCYNALSILEKNIKLNKLTLNQYKNNQQQYKNQLKMALDSIYYANKQSLSNGFLMRIWPMIVFHSLISKYHNKKQNIDDLRQLVEKQVRLTHSNEIAIDTAIQWVEMISQIINCNKKSQNIKQQQKTTMQLQQYDKIFDKFLSKNIYQGSLKHQILKSIKNKQPIIATQSIGYFKHAYHFSIYQILYLRRMHQMRKNSNSIFKFNPIQFKKSLQFVIKQGGDTDTNACIVGGFLGSIYGLHRLPKQYLNKQLNFKLDSGYRKGIGKMYEPMNGFVTLLKLIKKTKL